MGAGAEPVTRLQVYDQGPKAHHSELKVWLQHLNKAAFHLMGECIMILCLSWILITKPAEESS